VRTVEKDQKKIVPDVPDSSMGYVEIMEFATGFIRTMGRRRGDEELQVLIMPQLSRETSNRSANLASSGVFFVLPNGFPI
jgi:hypothetical protein